MMEMLFNYTMQMSEIDQLVGAVELLKTGKLSQLEIAVEPCSRL